MSPREKKVPPVSLIEGVQHVNPGSLMPKASPGGGCYYPHRVVAVQGTISRRVRAAVSLDFHNDLARKRFPKLHDAQGDFVPSREYSVFGAQLTILTPEKGGSRALFITGDSGKFDTFPEEVARMTIEKIHFALCERWNEEDDQQWEGVDWETYGTRLDPNDWPLHLKRVEYEE